MNASITWLVVAGVLIVSELLTGTFYLLMIAIGLLVGAMVAAIGFAPAWQMGTAAIVAACATLALHHSRFGWRRGKPASRDANVMLDIGQTLSVSEWIPNPHGHFHARTMYRGAMWDIECHQDQVEAGLFTIVEVQGSRLIVKPD